jgi:hypothetical protein
VDLVDEQHVALAEVGEDPHEVGAAVQGRSGGGDEHRAHLIGHDGGQRRLAQSRRTGEEHVVQRLTAPARRFYRDTEALHCGALAHVLVEALRPELALELRLFGQRHAAHHPGLVGHRASPPRTPAAGAPALR